MDRRGADESPDCGAGTKLVAHEGQRPRQLHEGGRPQGQLVQQHAIRRRQGRDRVPRAAIHPQARQRLRLPEAGRRQQSRDRVARHDAHQGHAQRHQPAQRLGVQHQRLALLRGRQGQPQARRLPAVHGFIRPQRARRTRHENADRRQRVHPGQADHRCVRFLPARVCAADSDPRKGLRRAARERSGEGETRRPRRGLAHLELPLGHRLDSDHAGRMVGRHFME